MPELPVPDDNSKKPSRQRPYDSQLRPEGQFPASPGESHPGFDPAAIRDGIAAEDRVPATGIRKAALESSSGGGFIDKATRGLTGAVVYVTQAGTRAARGLIEAHENSAAYRAERDTTAAELGDGRDRRADIYVRPDGRSPVLGLPMEPDAKIADTHSSVSHYDEARIRYGLAMKKTYDPAKHYGFRSDH